MLADRRLWVNQDRTKIVEDGGGDAAFLLCACAGAVIDPIHVDELGLVLDGGRVVQKALTAPPETKAIPAPEPAFPANQTLPRKGSGLKITRSK